jgi:hypothetical protein
MSVWMETILQVDQLKKVAGSDLNGVHSGFGSSKFVELRSKATWFSCSSFLLLPFLGWDLNE